MAKLGFQEKVMSAKKEHNSHHSLSRELPSPRNFDPLMAGCERPSLALTQSDGAVVSCSPDAPDCPPGFACRHLWTGIHICCSHHAGPAAPRVPLIDLFNSPRPLHEVYAEHRRRQQRPTSPLTTTPPKPTPPAPLRFATVRVPCPCLPPFPPQPNESQMKPTTLAQKLAVTRALAPPREVTPANGARNQHPCAACFWATIGRGNVGGTKRRPQQDIYPSTTPPRVRGTTGDSSLYGTTDSHLYKTPQVSCLPPAGDLSRWV